jgi:hypothetical protein
MLAEFNKAKGMSDIIASKMSNLEKVNKMAEGGEVKGEEADEYETVAAEMILAFEKRDPKLLVKAFQAMFEMCDAAPHEEGDHTDGPGGLLISGEI